MCFSYVYTLTKRSAKCKEVIPFLAKLNLEGELYGVLSMFFRCTHGSVFCVVMLIWVDTKNY